MWPNFRIFLSLLALLYVLHLLYSYFWTKRINNLLYSDPNRFIRESIRSIKRNHFTGLKGPALINFSAGLTRVGLHQDAYDVLQLVNERKLNKLFKSLYYNNLICVFVNLDKIKEANNLFDLQKELLLGQKNKLLKTAIKDTEAALLFHNGNLRESRAIFESMLTLSSFDGAKTGQHYYLGRIDWAEGNRSNSVEHFRLAAALGKKSAIIAEIKEFVAKEPELAGLLGAEVLFDEFRPEPVDLSEIRDGGEQLGTDTWKKVVFYLFIFIVALFLISTYSGFSQNYVTSDYSYAVDMLVDRLVESGIIPASVNYDDPVLAQSRTIIISEDINEKTSKEVAGKLIYLNGLNPEAPIDLIVKTHGGWTNDAYLICDVMHWIDAPVNTWSAGASYSAGAMILAAGTGTRYALPNTLVMVHVVDLEGDEPQEYYYESRTRTESFWRRHANLPEDYYPMIGDVEYYFSPEDALRYGIIDEIYEK